MNEQTKEHVENIARVAQEKAFNARDFAVGEDYFISQTLLMVLERLDTLQKDMDAMKALIEKAALEDEADTDNDAEEDTEETE